MASKVQQEKFNKQVEKIVLGMGGKLNSSLPYRWSLITKAGELLITVHGAEASKLFSIFCCFEDPKLAVEVLTKYNASNLNKHSGKFNFHRQDQKQIIFDFKESLSEIL